MFRFSFVDIIIIIFPHLLHLLILKLLIAPSYLTTRSIDLVKTYFFFILFPIIDIFNCKFIGCRH